MKKLTALALFILAASLFTGCRSPGVDPANVRGSSNFDPLNPGEFSIPGDNIMPPRFAPGGTEYPGMFEPVYFGYDSSQIAAPERAKVETVSNYLLSNPQTDLIIEGHTDERGSNEYNISLGEKRAQAIRTYLSSLGIEPERIQTKTLGEEDPVDPGHSEAAWKLNRRGEFILYY